MFSLLLVFTMLFTLLPTQSYATEPETTVETQQTQETTESESNETEVSTFASQASPASNSNLTIGTHSLSWVKMTGDVTQDSSDVWNQSVTRIRGNSATAQVNFSVGGDGDAIGVGEIEIRIPRYLYKD